MNIPSFIHKLVLNNIDVTITNNARIGICFDVNLQAKSHMYLYNHESDWWADMRYDTYLIQSYDDILYYAEKGMHGREFINSNWHNLLVKEGYL